LKELSVIQQQICHRSRKAVFSLAIAVLCSVSVIARADEPSERVTAAAKVFKELAGTPEGLPTSVLNKADCVIILPSVKKGASLSAVNMARA
jgi:hypothetical protein